MKYCNYIFNSIKELDIQYERYSLLLLSLLFLLLDKNYYNDYIFISIISFFSSLIILANFPWIIIWNSAKPIYYEDLYIDETKLPEIPLTSYQKNSYEKNYTRSLIFSNSILISILICYWKFKTENTSFIEKAGTTGGLLQMASILNNLLARLILYLIKSFISIKIVVTNDNNNENFDDLPTQIHNSENNVDTI
jgi:hypothetical protein